MDARSEPHVVDGLDLDPGDADYTHRRRLDRSRAANDAEDVSSLRRELEARLLDGAAISIEAEERRPDPDPRRDDVPRRGSDVEIEQTFLNAAPPANRSVRREEVRVERRG